LDILVLTNLFPNPIQPHLAPWNRAQLSALAERHSVRVISPVPWTTELFGRRRASASIPSGRRALNDRIAVEYPRYLYPPKILHSAHGECFRLSVASSFRRAVRERRPDVVFTSWAYPDGWAAVQLASEFHLPVVIRVLGSDVHLLQDHPSKRRRTVAALQSADRVIAVSQDLARATIELGVPEARVDVVYNGLNSEFFCPGSRRDARTRLGLDHDVSTLLFVGNLVPVKRVETLIDACGALKTQGIEFRCHLIGDGVLRTALASRISDLGLEQHVILHGQKHQDELVHWYRASDVVVLPSRSEGIPNVLLEATSCGIPFVARRVGGIPEIEGHPASRLVDSDDPGEFAREIIDILNTDSGDSPVPVPARSWKESSVDLEAIFLKVIQENAARSG